MRGLTKLFLCVHVCVSADGAPQDDLDTGQTLASPLTHITTLTRPSVGQLATSVDRFRVLHLALSPPIYESIRH